MLPNYSKNVASLPTIDTPVNGNKSDSDSLIQSVTVVNGAWQLVKILYFRSMTNGALLTRLDCGRYGVQVTKPQPCLLHSSAHHLLNVLSMKVARHRQSYTTMPADRKRTNENSWVRLLKLDEESPIF